MLGVKAGSRDEEQLEKHVIRHACNFSETELGSSF